MAKKTEAAVRVQQKKPLEELARLICEEHERVTGAQHTSLQHAVQCGDYLREASDQMEHGAWGPWVQANFLNKYKLAARTERKYRWFSEHQDKLPAMWQQDATFTWQKAEQIINKKLTEEGTKVVKPPRPRPRPTDAQKAAVKIILERRGIQADPGIVLNAMYALGVDVAKVLKDLERIAKNLERSELESWMASLTDKREEWDNATRLFGIDPKVMAHAASLAGCGVLAYSEGDGKEDRPGREWDLVIDAWDTWHYFAQSATWKPGEVAPAAAKWLAMHGVEEDLIDEDTATRLAGGE